MYIGTGLGLIESGKSRKNMKWQGQCLTIIFGLVTKITIADKKRKKSKHQSSGMGQKDRGEDKIFMVLLNTHHGLRRLDLGDLRVLDLVLLAMTVNFQSHAGGDLGHA
jgi:hypothetical protein